MRERPGRAEKHRQQVVRLTDSGWGSVDWITLVKRAGTWILRIALRGEYVVA